MSGLCNSVASYMVAVVGSIAVVHRVRVGVPQLHECLVNTKFRWEARVRGYIMQLVNRTKWTVLLEISVL